MSQQVVNLDNLLAAIADIKKIPDDQWKASLAGRKLAELEFHDRDRDRAKIATLDKDTFERFYGNKKYYAATSASRDYVTQWIAKETPGKVFLDYACGNGANARLAARAGAALAIGIDISPVSIANATADAEAESLAANTQFFQADAENTKLPDGCIDRVICSGMLHHLDLSYAFPELRRILAPGGKILCVEALDYNPAIKLYRYLTPAMRTKWEAAHILSLKDVRFGERFFKIGETRYWHITGIAAPHFKWLAPILHGIDAVLTKIPGVQLMAWIFTFELLKRAD
jgi:ubiquinone/menaquinone biosynthesis C-methylase UbiE